MGNTTFIDRVFEAGVTAWEKLPQVLLTIVVGYIAIKLIKALLHSVIRVSSANKAMKGVLMSVVDVGLWILVLAAILQQVGLGNIALALSGTVAIAGVAMAIGASSFVQDMVAGVFLAQDPDFNVGDTIEVEDIVGRVERMDARKVRIKDGDDKLHVYPNSTFDKTSWVIIKRRGKETK